MTTVQEWRAENERKARLWDAYQARRKAQRQRAEEIMRQAFRGPVAGPKDARKVDHR